MALCWVVPIGLLVLLNCQAYFLIEGNMNPSERRMAYWLGGAGMLNLLAGVIAWTVMFFAERRSSAPDKPLSSQWGWPVVVIQIAYLWSAFWGAEDMIPRTVQQWIYPAERYLYHQFALAMIPLFWGLLRMACIQVIETKRHAVLVRSFGLVIGVPIVLFMVVQLLSVIGSGAFFSSAVAYIIVTLIVLAGVFVMMGLVRLLVYGMQKVDRWSIEGQLAFIGVFALLMPWAGLTLNISIPFPNDFQALEVYVLTTLNAGVLAVACWGRERFPRLCLGLLCATFPFSLYFFVVFLPFLPLTPLAMIALGSGFLILTPTVLATIHLVLIHRAQRVAGVSGVLIGLGCFLLLPGFFTVRGIADRAALNGALDFIYTPKIENTARQYPGNLTNLRRALANHTAYKNGIYYPLLSDYYAWLVFDNLILPDDKLEHLQRSFFASTPADMILDRNESRIFRRSDVRTRHAMPSTWNVPQTVTVTQFDFQAEPLAPPTSRLTLRLELTNNGPQPAEFSQTIPLPPGVFVSGFRLQVMGELVPGRIFEKKTALWVYTMIRNTERRDPGIVYYNSHDELELKVFPVSTAAPSWVEIDFTLPHAFAASSDLEEETGDAFAALQKLIAPRHPLRATTKDGITVAAGLPTLDLPVVPLGSYVHLIVDRSAKTGISNNLAAALDRIAQRFPEAPIRRITLANFETATTSVNAPQLQALPQRGGVLVDPAIAQAIQQYREFDLDSAEVGAPPLRPIFVILSTDSAFRLPDLNLTEAWTDLVPALTIHHLHQRGDWATLTDPSEATTPMLRWGNSIRPLLPDRPVRFAANQIADLPEFWNSHRHRWEDITNIIQVPSEAKWTQAVSLTTQQQDFARGTRSSIASFQELIRQSRTSGILIEPSSYIVVENAAQWRMLEQSEDQKLAQNVALDFRETPTPSGWLLVIGFGIWQITRRRTRNSIPHHSTAPLGNA
ncbi:MAG: hypothetical protein SynsKO_08890 [Synoicihabitans sp.]